MQKTALTLVSTPRSSHRPAWAGLDEAERLAREGKLQRAWERYRAAAAAAGVLLRPPPRSQCPVCGGSDAPLCWVGTDESASVLAWVRCADCRTARRAVPPTTDDTLEARRAALSSQEMTLARLHKGLSQHDGLITRIRDAGYGLRWLERPGGSGRASMLVIGSGWGALLASAEWRGFEVQGTESDVEAAGWAREALGAVVWPTLAEVPPTAHDVIVVQHGLGETDAPADLLAALSRRLVPEGLLAVTVPCLDHPVHRALGYDNPRWIAPDAAVWFDRAGISLALIRAGLQPIGSWHHPERPGEIVILTRKE